MVFFLGRPSAGFREFPGNSPNTPATLRGNSGNSGEPHKSQSPCNGTPLDHSTSQLHQLPSGCTCATTLTTSQSTPISMFLELTTDTVTAWLCTVTSRGDLNMIFRHRLESSDSAARSSTGREKRLMTRFREATNQPHATTLHARSHQSE